MKLRLQTVNKFLISFSFLSENVHFGPKFDFVILFIKFDGTIKEIKQSDFLPSLA